MRRLLAVDEATLQLQLLDDGSDYETGIQADLVGHPQMMPVLVDGGGLTNVD